MTVPTTPTLRDAERYVGMPYVEGEFDCASLAVLVQRELFGREVDLPAASARARGRRGQGRDVRAHQPRLADAVPVPSTGDAVLFWAGAGPQRRWHVGTAFLGDGETWVLHCADEVRGAALTRLQHLIDQGQHLDGFYAWRGQPVPRLDVAIARDPMGGRVETRITLAGRSLAETLRAEGIEGPGWIVSVGGIEVPVEYWGRTRVKPGQLIEARALMRKQVLMMVAMIALTYFTFGAGAIFSGFAANAALFVGGSMLIQATLGPKMASMGDMSSLSPPPTYSLQGGRNSERPFESLMLMLGESKVIPDKANQPFTWFEGDDQFMSAMFHAGINCASISALKLGDTPLENYEAVTVRRYGFPADNSGTPPVIGTSADTVEGGLLDNPNKDTKGPFNTHVPAEPGPWITRTSSANSARIEIDIEGTLQDMNGKGKWVTATARFEMQFRVVGAPEWLPLGPGTELLTHMGPKPLRRTFGFDLQPAQYEVRLRKITPNAGGNDSGSPNAQNTMAWQSLKSYQPDTADYGGQPRVELRMKATGQLNGAPDEVNWLGRAAGMDYWNGSAWVTVTEPGAAGVSNPGAQILLLLRGIYRGEGAARQLIAGRGLSDDRIDIESLKGFMVHCAARGYRFDMVVQETMELDALLDSIAAAGLGTMSRHSGRRGVVWMADGQPIEGVINMAAMKARSFSVRYDLQVTADEFQLEFFDADRGWTWQPIRVPAPGVVTPQRTSRSNVRGVNYEAHASTLARFFMGQSVFGRKSITFEMDLEHLSYRRGAVVALSHDLTQWGYGGALYAVEQIAGGFVVTVDEPVPTTGGATRMLGLQFPGEQQMRVFPVASVSDDGRRLTVMRAFPDGVVLPAAAHDVRWIYDFKATPGYRCRVTHIEPVDNMRGAQITVVPEGPEFWHFVATGEYIAPPNNSLLDPGLPVASNLRITRNRVRVGDAWEHELSAAWDVLGNYDHAQVWAAPVGAPLERITPDVFGTQLSWRVPAEQTWSVEVRPFDALGRPGVRVSQVFTDPSVVVGQVAGLAAVVESTGVVLRWAVPQQLDAVDWSLTQIRMGLAGATWETASRVFEGRADSVNLGWLMAGTQVFFASHGNSAGDWSAPVSASLEILPPGQPIVTGAAWSLQVELDWTDVPGTQPLRGYEVRVGPIYADAVVRTVVDAQGYVYTTPAADTYMHWVTAIDMAGNRGTPGYLQLVTTPEISVAIEQLQEGLDEIRDLIDNMPEVENQWGVRVVSANGPMVGGLIFGNSGTQTDFIVLSDRFAWALPDGSGVKYPLVLGLINGVPSFGFTGNMYVDGTIQARMVGADQIRGTHIRGDEIEARHLKVGSVVADRMAVGISGNLLRNSAVVTAKGWSTYTASPGLVSFGRNLAEPDWKPPAENTLAIHQSSGPGAGGGIWYSDSACAGGTRYCVSAPSAAHNCFTHVSMQFFDAAGADVAPTGVSGDSTNSTHIGGKNLSGYKRIYQFATAPAAAVTVRVWLNKGDTAAGQTYSYGWFVRPMLEEAGPYQTSPSAYQVAGVGTLIDENGLSVSRISAISEDMGIMVRGRMVSADGKMTIDMDGRQVFMTNNGYSVHLHTGGFVMSGPSGRYLSFDMASGVMSTNMTLNGSDGTFSGTLTAAAVNAVKSVNIAGGSVTAMVFAQGSVTSIGVGTNIAAAGITMVAGATGVIIHAVVRSSVPSGGSGGSGSLAVQVIKASTGASVGGGSDSGSAGDRLYISVLAFDPYPTAGSEVYYLRVSAVSRATVATGSMTINGGQR